MNRAMSPPKVVKRFSSAFHELPMSREMWSQITTPFMQRWPLLGIMRLQVPRKYPQGFIFFPEPVTITEVRKNTLTWPSASLESHVTIAYADECNILFLHGKY